MKIKEVILESKERPYVEHTAVNESDEGSETKYGVFRKGGSIGNNSMNDKPMKVYDNAEDAKAYASRLRKQLTPGEKGYYKMGFVVKKINEAYDPFAMDGEEDDYDEPQSNVQNIIAQLEKAQDFDGNKVINFENGDQKKLPLKAIEIFLAAYGSVKDKKQMSADAASSIDGFVAAVKDSVSGKYGKAQKSTYDGMAGSRTGGMTYYN